MDRIDRTKVKTGFNRKVRVIAKIRGFTDLEAEASSCVSVHKPNGDESESVSICFGDQSNTGKELCELDYCYGQNEGNDAIFTREVKPLISGVFDGRNVTVIANGARRSGKTHVIQGSDKAPGLTLSAMAEILSIAEEIGNSITISFYEIFQDHVYDLLDPKRKKVLALENGQGKILLKGLSQVPVKSLSEFQKLYHVEHNPRKPVQKIAIEFPQPSHRCLTINVSSPSDSIPIGKMNFVDLAGYEDARRRSNEGLNLAESIKINRSIHALHNVVYALNANKSHVPYRESKLTRMLQDSLGGKNIVLMLTCLNPSFCQDSIYMVNLASRCRQCINQTISSRPLLHSSPRSQLPESVSPTRKQIGNKLHFSTKKAKDAISESKGRYLPGSVSTTKKKIGNRLLFSTKKANGAVSETKGRKLFDEASHLTSSETIYQKESSVSAALSDKYSTFVVEKDASPSTTTYPQETIVTDKDSFLHSENNYREVTPSITCNLKTQFVIEDSANFDKENNDSHINKDGSPLISEQLQQISNNLKLLLSSTPQHLEMALGNESSSNIQSRTDFVEPKTPERSVSVNDNKATNINSPWSNIHMHNSKMKDSLAKDYLKILNTGGRDDLMKLKGIGEKRANYIFELREESPEHFKSLDDLKDIGLSAKQIKQMMSKGIEELL